MIKKIYAVLERVVTLGLIGTMIYLLIRVNIFLNKLIFGMKETQETLLKLCEILKGSWFF